jgi:hypothetical protein
MEMKRNLIVALVLIVAIVVVSNLPVFVISNENFDIWGVEERIETKEGIYLHGLTSSKNNPNGHYLTGDSFWELINAGVDCKFNPVAEGSIDLDEATKTMVTNTNCWMPESATTVLVKSVKLGKTHLVWYQYQTFYIPMTGRLRHYPTQELEQLITDFNNWILGKVLGFIVSSTK